MTYPVLPPISELFLPPIHELFTPQQRGILPPTLGQPAFPTAYSFPPQIIFFGPNYLFNPLHFPMTPAAAPSQPQAVIPRIQIPPPLPSDQQSSIVTKAVEQTLNAPKRRKNSHTRRSIIPSGWACQACDTKTTPEIRRGPNGGGTLCNACGLKWTRLSKENPGQKINIDMLFTDRLLNK
jgi:transcription elongation factor Elf1